jgi:hypothetical protein
MTNEQAQADQLCGLEILARLAQLDSQVSEMAAWLATSLRSRGTTWEAIGQAIGTTPQGAYWRYGRGQPGSGQSAEERRAS